MASAKPIPEGFTSITPYVTFKDAGAAIDFYKKAFGAEEIFRMPGAGGKGVMHAEIKIGNAILMLNDECIERPGPRAPDTLNGTSVTIHLYVKDVDAAFKRAVDAGATETMPVADMFWGDRFGSVVDPFGHHWGIATHKEDLTPEQIGKGAEEFFKNMASCGQ